MNISLDIDGVIINFVSSFSRSVKKKLNYDLKYEDIYCHDIGQVLGVTKEIIHDLVHETLVTNDFDIIDQAKDSIQYLYKNHQINLITGRDEQYKAQTLDLLKRHDIPFHSLHFCNYMKKYQVELPHDIFVEDSVQEAVILSQKKEIRVLLFDHPWNQNTLDIMSSFKRVFNWSDIVAEIEC